MNLNFKQRAERKYLIIYEKCVFFVLLFKWWDIIRLSSFKIKLLNEKSEPITLDDTFED